MFYDMVVHTKSSIGENELSEVVEMARKLGLSGICVPMYYTSLKDLKEYVNSLPHYDDIDIVSGVIVKADRPQDINNIVSMVRQKIEIVIVHGSSYEVNRVACENSKVDILAHPELNRNDSGLDHICVKSAAENNVAIEINFREILESSGILRVKTMKKIMKNIELCKNYKTPIITTSSAVSKWNMRSGRELASIAHLVGLPIVDAIDTVSTIPLQIVEENRKKLQGKKIGDVEVINDGQTENTPSDA